MTILPIARHRVRQTKQRRRMHRDHRLLAPLRRSHRAARFANLYHPAEKGPGGGRAQTHQIARANLSHFRLPPALTRFDFAGVGLLVQPALSAWLPLEVFDGVGHITLRPIDAGVGEGAIQQFSRRPNKRSARQILLITRLLADKDNLGRSRSFAEDGLRSMTIEIARFTTLRLALEQRKTRGLFRVRGRHHLAQHFASARPFAPVRRSNRVLPSHNEPSSQAARCVAYRLGAAARSCAGFEVGSLRNLPLLARRDVHCEQDSQDE